MQVCGPEELESLRDDMRALKRVCRQRTLLGWKKTRIAQEQAVVGALRDSAAQLDRHLATIKVGARCAGPGSRSGVGGSGRVCVCVCVSWRACKKCQSSLSCVRFW